MVFADPKVDEKNLDKLLSTHQETTDRVLEKSPQNLVKSTVNYAPKKERVFDAPFNVEEGGVVEM